MDNKASRSEYSLTNPSSEMSGEDPKPRTQGNLHDQKRETGYTLPF